MATKTSRILFLALNEIKNAIAVPDLYRKLNSNETEINSLFEEFNKELENTDSSLDIQTIEGLRLQRNVLCELFKELASFEFETRLGFSEEEVFDVLKTIRKKIDLKNNK